MIVGRIVCVALFYVTGIPTFQRVFHVFLFVFIFCCGKGLRAVKLKDTSDEDKVESSETQTGALSRSCSSSSSSLDSRYGPAIRSRASSHWKRPPLWPQQERQSHGSRGPQPSTYLSPLQPMNTTPHPGPSGRIPVGGGMVVDVLEFHVGERVLVVGQRTGVVRFSGKTSFAPGLWLGIELDKPSGKNDGSVGGVRYFRCPLKHGVFAPPSRVQRIHGSVDCLSELSSSRPNQPLAGMHRSFSTSTAISTPKEQRCKSPANRNRSGSIRRHRSAASSAGGTDASSHRPSSSVGGTTTSSSPAMVKLHVGMQVLLSSVSEMGTIRYLGTTEFAPGLWLGLELRNSRGKNDGSVEGRRYFSCRPGYGVLVRPSRVTYRGINGAKLVEEAN